MIYINVLTDEMEILMKTNFYMPVKVLFEDNCIANHQDIFADFGKKALIVTGRNSAKISD